MSDPDVTLLSFPSLVAKCESVLCADVHGGGGGKASDHPHSVLLEDLQGLGALTASCQYHLRLQSEHSNLFAGKQQLKNKTWSQKNNSKNMLFFSPLFMQLI